MNTEFVDIDSLTLDPKNARSHDTRNIDAIAGSLERFGQQKPIVVNAEGLVVAGNGTVAAAKKLGWTRLSVVRTELVGPDARAFSVADNRTAELAVWDDQVLGEVLAELQNTEGFDADVTGFSNEEIDQLIAQANGLNEIEQDEVPEPPANPITQLGDVWHLGRHRLICGDSDSEGIIPESIRGTITLVLTDPPYNTDMDGRMPDVYQEKKGRSDKTNHQDTKKWDASYDPTSRCLPQVVSALARDANVVIFGGTYLRWKYLHPYFHSLGIDWAHREYYWVKKFASSKLTGASYANATEVAIIAYRKGHKFYPQVGPKNWDYTWLHHNEGGSVHSSQHPTSKPVALFRQLMESNSAPGDIVYDPFLGSGTTLIAAEQLGRTCYGCEIDPGYCDVICERWAKLTGEKAERVVVT